MFCKWCGVPNDDDAVFCTGCGRSVADRTNPIATPTSEGSQSVPPPMSYEPFQSAPVSAGSTDARNPTVPIIAVVVVALGLTLGGVLLLSARDDDSSQAGDAVDVGSRGSEPVADPATSEVDPEPSSVEPAQTEAVAQPVAQDFLGAEVTITGPERDDPSITAIQKTLDGFAETANMTITYIGDADWEANINTQVADGNPPDISMFPQPGKLADFARAGSVVALSDRVDAAVDEAWIDDFQLYGNVDGTQYGVPVKTDVKSLVWYQPGRFANAGYEVPTTIDGFTALMARMVADGNTPLCVGIESGPATGWIFTDWVEDMVLRQHGGDVYDQWVGHEIPFDDPRIVESMQTVVDFWEPENVFASGGSIAATGFADNAQPLVDGDCFMHRQASFFAGFFPEGTVFADGSNPDSVDTFYFPDVNGDRPVLTASVYAAAFNDNEATMAVLEFMAGPEYPQERQRIQAEELGEGLSGFLSAAQGQDTSVYQPLEKGFIEILNNTQLARFDGSDLMPAAVGAGSFWSEATLLVTGEQTAGSAASNIEASWPS